MPQIIEHIDAIARKVERGVLFLVFFQDQDGAPVRERWDVNPSRKEVISWLDANGYAWRECGEIASDDWLTMGYRGSIYLATAFDEGDPAYQKLEQYLESPDGTLRLPKMRFLLLTMEAALRNAHHDAPGYWEKRAESF